MTININPSSELPSLPDFSPFQPDELKPEDLDPRLKKPEPPFFLKASCAVLWICALVVAIAGTLSFVRWAL